jgi:hypothetical protein
MEWSSATRKKVNLSIEIAQAESWCSLLRGASGMMAETECQPAAEFAEARVSILSSLFWHANPLDRVRPRSAS